MRTNLRGLSARIGLGVVLAVGLAACGGDGSNAGEGAEVAGSAEARGAAGGGGADAPAEGAEVVIELVAFKPTRLHIDAGTTVTWQQQDTGAHTVTSGTVEQGAAGVTTTPDATFDSGELSTGETFRHTFEAPGTVPYFCALHPATMRGEIHVT